MLIVNADDFGYSPEVNDAIARCFRNQLISSTTIMANAPGFNAACNIAKAMKLEDKIGIHLNVTEGIPVTDTVKNCRIFCDPDSRFCFRREAHLALRPNAMRALQQEIEGQISRCRSAGLPLTHADSHHHWHTELPMFLPVVPVLRKFRIPFVRLSDNVRDASFLRKTYKTGFNLTLSLFGFRGTHFFCDLAGLGKLRDRLDRDDVVVEVMVHPTYSADGTLIDAMSKLPFAKAMKDAIGLHRLGSYADLK